MDALHVTATNVSPVRNKTQYKAEMLYPYLINGLGLAYKEIYK